MWGAESAKRVTTGAMKKWRATAIVLGIAVVGLTVVITVQSLMLRAHGWRIAWGTVPDWVAAVGGVATVGALVRPGNL